MKWSINWFSTLGLLADIIGVLIAFRYGLPSQIDIGELRRLEESESTEITRLRKNQKIRCWAYLGLAFLLLGFILQLIGSNLSQSTYCSP